MERDRDLILESYAALAPEALDALSPEERRKAYVILKLTVVALADGGLKISGVFGEETPVWETAGTSRRFSSSANPSPCTCLVVALILGEGAPPEISFRALSGT
jgi:hypothetical protein